MKKYLSFMAFAMMAVFSLALVSCSDDDNEENVPEENVPGDDTTDYTKDAEGQISVYSMSNELKYTIDVNKAGWCNWKLIDDPELTFSFLALFNTTSYQGQISSMNFYCDGLDKKNVGKEIFPNNFFVKVNSIKDGYLVDETYECYDYDQVLLAEFGNPYVTIEFNNCTFSNGSDEFKLKGKIKFPIRHTNASNGTPKL